MNKAFELWQWENEPSAETPLSAEFLNRLNNGLNEVDNRVINQNTTKLDVTTANTMVKDVTFDSASGIFTITKLNGSTFNIDTKLEKLAVNFEFDSSTQTLNIILEDGTTQTVDLSTLITQYEFGESDTIVLTVNSSGKVMANIKFGSITGNMLEPNYLANTQSARDTALAAANSAEASATRAKGSEESASSSAEICQTAVDEIKNKLELAEFDIDDNGNLIYTDNSAYNFTVDDNGNLNWEVA